MSATKTHTIYDDVGLPPLTECKKYNADGGLTCAQHQAIYPIAREVCAELRAHGVTSATLREHQADLVLGFQLRKIQILPDYAIEAVGVWMRAAERGEGES